MNKMNGGDEDHNGARAQLEDTRGIIYLTNRKWFSVVCTLIFRFVFYHNIQRQRKFLFQSVTKIITQRKSKRCL